MKSAAQFLIDYYPGHTFSMDNFQGMAALIPILHAYGEQVKEACALEVEEYSPKVIPDRIRQMKLP